MKRVIILSLIEAFIVAFAFCFIKMHYDSWSCEYNTNIGFYSCDCTTSFNTDVVGEDGTVYPAGTVFNVYSICDDGIIAIESIDGSYRSHSEFTIEDVRNSEELYDYLNRIKQQIVDDYREANVITVVISLVIAIALSFIFYIINLKSKNKPVISVVVLVIIVLLCVFTVFTANGIIDGFH